MAETRQPEKTLELKISGFTYIIVNMLVKALYLCILLARYLPYLHMYLSNNYLLKSIVSER